MPDAGAVASGGGSLADDFVELAIGRGFVPTSHLTLTFGRGREMVTVERAVWLWRFLVRRLNEYVGGKGYRRKWGHSYFSYMMGVERHRDGVPHAHAVVDAWIDYTLVHEIWNRVAGHAWIRKIEGDPMAAVRYVVKYVCKSDLRPMIWFQPEKRGVNKETGAVFRQYSAGLGGLSRPA